MAERIPAEEEEIWTSEERCDNNENVFIVEGTKRTTRNHQQNDAVGDE